MKNKILIAALLFPILGLTVLASFRAYKLHTGYEMTLDVQGYEPRDILSGHYVVYTVDYGPFEDCYEYLKKDTGSESAGETRIKISDDEELCVCYSNPPDATSGYWTRCNDVNEANCPVYIRGKCNYRRFEAGIEKFFVPETQAGAYDAILREEGAELVIKIDSNGKASVADLKLPVSIEDWQKKQEK